MQMQHGLEARPGGIEQWKLRGCFASLVGLGFRVWGLGFNDFNVARTTRRHKDILKTTLSLLRITKTTHVKNRSLNSKP